MKINERVADVYTAHTLTGRKYSPAICYDVPVGDIDHEDRRFQMRMEGHNIEGVKESIKEIGQLTPVVLLNRPRSEKLVIISGFTRVLAVKDLQRTHVRAHIRNDAGDSEAMSIAYAENVTREDLTDWEKINGVMMLLEKGKLQKDIAKDFGKSPALINIYVKIHNGKKIITDALRQGKIDITKARYAVEHQDSLSDKELTDLIEHSSTLTVASFDSAAKEVSEGASVKKAVSREMAPGGKKKEGDIAIYREKTKRGFSIKMNILITEDNVKRGIFEVKQLLEEMEAYRSGADSAGVLLEKTNLNLLK